HPEPLLHGHHGRGTQGAPRAAHCYIGPQLYPDHGPGAQATARATDYQTGGFRPPGPPDRLINGPVAVLAKVRTPRISMTTKRSSESDLAQRSRKRSAGCSRACGRLGLEAP